MRKFLAAAAAALLLVTLSACGASGGESDGAADAPETTKKAETTTTTEPGAESLPVDEWADGFCTDFESWVKTLETQSQAIENDVQPGDVEGAQKAIVGLFDQVSQETQDLVDSLGESYPDIEDGDQFASDLQEKFQGFVDATEKSKAKAEELATDDPTQFQSDVESIVDEFKSSVDDVGNSFAELDTKYPDQDLQDALQKSCDI